MESLAKVARFTCQICGKRKVVETLARDCEKRHLEDEG